MKQLNDTETCEGCEQEKSIDQMKMDKEEGFWTCQSCLDDYGFSLVSDEDRAYLIGMYNATSQGNDKDQIETYEAWLERQLLSRLKDNWIPVTDRLPECSGPTLVYDPRETTGDKVFEDMFDGRGTNKYWVNSDPSHWQSIPDPPKTDNHERI
jgi:hypothetical protein